MHTSSLRFLRTIENMDQHRARLRDFRNIILKCSEHHAIRYEASSLLAFSTVLHKKVFALWWLLKGLKLTKSQANVNKSKCLRKNSKSSRKEWHLSIRNTVFMKQDRLKDVRKGKCTHEWILYLYHFSSKLTRALKTDFDMNNVPFFP